MDPIEIVDEGREASLSEIYETFNACYSKSKGKRGGKIMVSLRVKWISEELQLKKSKERS